MKKVVAVCLVIVMTLSFFGCGKGEATDTQTGQTGGVTTSTENTSTTIDIQQTTVSSQETTKTFNKTQTTTAGQAAHTHQYSSKVTKSASCLKEGVKTFLCACGKSYTEKIPAAGHGWGDWVTVKRPTAIEKGTAERKCGKCGDVQQKTLPMLDIDGKIVVTEQQLQVIEQRFLQLVNEERRRMSAGGPPLSIDPYLDSRAQLRSEEIIESFSHTRPNGRSFDTVVDTNSYPYSILGENLCMTSHVGDQTYTSADKWTGSDAQLEAVAVWIFTGFKNSPGHYANMIKAEYQHCGIGISYTQYDDILPMFYLAHLFGAK